MVLNSDTQTQTVYSDWSTSPVKEAPNTRSDSEKVGKSLSEKSHVGNFRWADVLIPEKAGKGSTKLWYQYRTLLLYAVFYVGGLYVNQTAKSPSLRAAALGLLFPGAGLTTVASIPSSLSFVFSTALIPLVLFAWFGCGGVSFPIFLWTGTAGLAAYLARDALFEQATHFWAVACIVGIAWVSIRTKNAHTAAEKRRFKRNAYLVQEVQANQGNATAPVPGSREVDPQTLRFVQWFIELALSKHDDWSYHDVIDQFQTAAVRYQLYESVYALGLYQCHYVPGFHGYLNAAQQNSIRKSCTKFVLNFWKWESLLGKFNAHDWNPIKKDNIMVTGYMLQAIGIYQNNTGDKCFEEDDCLELVVTENAKFKTNFQGISDAVYENMNSNPYTLYPCEPNWHYTPCNLVAIGGVVVGDRALKRDHGAQLQARFEKSLEEEFTEADGSILPIRSELTGFTIPGLCGVMTDCINSTLSAAYLPHIAHRNWAMARKETVQYDTAGKLNLVGLKGADKIDPGNYKAGVGCIRAAFASAAAEFGDRKVSADCIEQVDTEMHPVMETATGALRNKGLSTIAQGSLLRARLSRYQDWTNMMTVGPPPNALSGPLLTDCKFPDVLVAKAYSHDGQGLDLVLYNGNEAGVFDLGFERLQPGKEYMGQHGKKFTADSQGKAKIKANLDGRTPIMIQLV